MTIRIVLAKDYIDPLLNRERDIRLYFLGGPIRGADDWHKDAIELLSKMDPGCIIACPRRYKKGHVLYKHKLENMPLDSQLEKDLKLDEFENQTMWERHYLDIAAWRGCIIFWLPLESKTHPRMRKDGPYAQDTYGELGRWSIKSATQNRKDPTGLKKVNLVIGADAKFYGLNGIQKNFSADHGMNKPGQLGFPIYSTLEQTLFHAVTKAYS